MKIKKLGIGLLLLAGTLALGSCVKNKKVNPTDTGSTTVTDTDPKTTVTDPITGSTKPTSPTEPEPTLPPQTDVTIDPIEDESLINSIYVDFNKATLPKTYVPFVKEVFSSSLKLNEEEQKALINNYSCISAKGVQIENEEETPFLIDSALKLSTDESYIGFVLTPIVVNMTDYVNDLIAYEEEQYGEISTPTYYVFQNKTEKVFIISIESKDGSNRDLVVINESGIGSYINYSSKDYKFETVLEAKNKLTEDDLSLLNDVPCIRYNNDVCLFRITDYSITDLVIPGSYRTIPFNDLDLNDLDRCNNLASISLNGSNKYRIVDGVLYNKDLTNLLYYPKAKEAESFEILDSVTEIRFGVFKNLKNLKELIYSDGISSIRDFEFENSNLEKIVMNDSITSIGNGIFKGNNNLKDITIPFTNDNGSLLEYFQTEEDSSLNEVLYNNTTYYLPSIENLNILHGDISENTFLGISESLKNIILSSEVKELNNTNFAGSFDNLISITALGCKTLDDELFKDCVNLEEVNFDLDTIGNATFSGCTNLKTIDTSKLTEVPNEAFYHCKSLEAVDITNVTSIGEKAFYQSSITNINGLNVTSIGSYSFGYCSKLSNVNLPKITTITERAFQYCTSLENISFGQLTQIGIAAFSNCSKITSIDTSKVKSLGSSVFYGCSSLTSISITSLQDYTLKSEAFYGCSNLSSVYLSTYVSTIGSRAVYNCEKLNHIDFTRVKVIETNAFSRCSSLKSLTMTGTSIEASAFSYSGLETVNLNISGTIGNDAFGNCDYIKTFVSSNESTTLGETILSTNLSARPNLKTVSIASKTVSKRLFSGETLTGASITLSLTSLNSNNNNDIKYFETINIDSVTSLTNISIPNCKNLSANSVTTLSQNQFKNNTKLTTVSFNSVTQVPISCFSGCSSLKTASFEKLTTISENCFYNCTSLQSFDFANVTSASGFAAFAGCTALTTVTGSKVTEVGQSVFYGCTSLKNIGFASNLTSIFSGGFGNCSSIESFTNSKITEIDGFTGCTGLKSISFSNATVVKPNAFEGCSSLNSINLPKLTSIGGSSFKDCTSLTEFSSSTLKYFDASTFYSTSATAHFYGCTSLKTVNIPNLTTIFSSMFYGCTSLTNLTTGNITKVDSYAFYNCSSIKTVNIGSTTALGNDAFHGCTSLTSIGDTSLTTIGDYAFYGCTSFSSFSSSFSSVQTIGKYAFYNCSKLSSQPWYTLDQNNPLTSIGDHAFEYTCLWNITLGDKITTIGTDAFKNLKYINSNITSQTLTITYNSTTSKLFSNMSSSSFGSLFSNNVTSFIIYSYSSSYPLSTLQNLYTGYIYNYYYTDKTYSDGSFCYIWFKKS